MLAEPALAERSTRVSRRSRADAVYVGGRKMWAGERGERVVSKVRWSKRRDAVAFAVRGRVGGDQLVVVLVGGEVEGHTMRWAVPDPSRKRGPRRPTVTWMGKARVAYGADEVRPTVVASWTVR
jgi:hypothetical protein